MFGLFKKKPIKACNDCAFMTYEACSHPAQQSDDITWETGARITSHTSVHLMRGTEGYKKCGKKAKYFKLKEE